MKIGTRSILYGVHCWFIHPFFVARGWWHLYGFPWDPRLWVAFFVHDLGYIGKPNMDGVEGEAHVLAGARLMGKLFGGDWYVFTMFHSRFYSKMNAQPPSRLCYADKMAFVFTPWWLYRLQSNWSGEIHEYMGDAAKGGKYAKQQAYIPNQEMWFRQGQWYIRRWVDTHYKGREDTWTQLTRN